MTVSISNRDRVQDIDVQLEKDESDANDLMLALDDLRQNGKAVLVSTHDVFRAKRLADEVGILRQGIKVAEHSRQELEDQSLEELYLRHMETEEMASTPTQTTTLP